MQIDKQPEAQTKLPPLSRAAAAQRLNERPLPPNPGLYYDVPHNPLHPRGWYLRRHLKRKNLRRSNQLYAATDRAGIRWSMLPLCFFILTLIIAAASFFAGYSAFAGAVNQHYQGAIASLVDILPGDSLRMYDEHGTMIYEALDQGLQISEPLGSISSNLVHAEIAIEDQYFWTNPGYDITGIVRAALSDLTNGRVVAGGSTITQQLIKNVVVGSENTITRKLQEIILAPEATRYYTKQQIMEMYLNTTYYGNQAYGAEAAASIYFGLQDTPKATAAAQLDIAQAAMLAGMPQNPTLYNPFLHPQATFNRMKAVLNQMYLQGYITPVQERAAMVEAQSPNFLHPGVVNNGRATHFVAYALNELASTLHVRLSDLSRSGLVVETTLDLPLQNKILKVARENVAALSTTNHLTDAAE